MADGTAAGLHSHVCKACGAILACEDGWCDTHDLPACPRPACGAVSWRREDGPQ